MIPVFKPSVSQKEIDAVSKVLESGWWGLGPKTREFEEAFAAFVGSKYAIGLNSGTAALHLSLYLLNLKKGDEVLVPTITFISTAHAVEYVGATPVFVDVCPDTCCMDPEDAKKKITPKTKAIIPVHYGGHPVKLDDFQNLAQKNNLTIIEDAAHATGAEYKGNRIGSISPLTCFSFHAVKNLACGEGGGITTNSDEWETRLRELRWLGISKDTWKRASEEKVYAWQYWIHETGFKAHMHDISASLGLVQLERLEQLNARRRELVNHYSEAFSDLDWIEKPIEKDNCKSSWHIYHIKTPRRDDLLSYLKKNDIAPGVHYYPIHMHPQYADQGRDHACPVAERIWPRLLSLPLFPDMTETQHEKVIKTVKAFDKIARERSKNLRGEHIQLRRIDFTDIERIRIWRNAPEIRQWFFDSREISKTDQEKWFDKYLINNDDEMFIIEAFSTEPIGMIALYNIDRHHEQAEIGRILIGDKRSLGCGFASDAVQVLVAYGFQKLGLKRIYAEIRHDNESSIELFKRTGFIEEGRKRQAVKKDNRWYDVILMSAIKEGEF